MKLRPSLLLLPLVTVLSLGTLAPAQAAATDPVTDLSVSVEQAPGAHDSWKVTASWTANPDAASYGVVIADHADGTVTSGKAYGNQDTSATSVVLTTSKLVAGKDYWVAVQPIAPATGTLSVASFHTGPLDTTGPTGTYTLDRTTLYLPGYYEEEGDLASTGDGPSAVAKVSQTSIGPGTVTRQVVAGDGSTAHSWTSNQPFGLVYTKPGTFTPHVLLTDEFANTTDIALPAVHVIEDKVAPAVTITRPADPGRRGSWRVVRGTASDAGIGLEIVGTYVAEKRGATWWTYDFHKRKWLKGSQSLRKSIRKSRARPAFFQPDGSGNWKAPAIRGLTKGLLHVEAYAIDQNFNGRLVQLDQRIG